jgi:hypothetical protein
MRINLVLEPGQKQNLEGTFTKENEEDYYKVMGTGVLNPHWTYHGAYLSSDYHLSCKTEIMDQWLEAPPKLDLKYFNEKCEPVTPKLGVIDPFSREFSNKNIYIKVTNPAGCNCVGTISYKLSVEFVVSLRVQAPNATTSDWFERKVGIPSLLPDIFIGDHFSKPVEVAISKLKKIAEKGTVEDKKIAAGVLDDLGTLARMRGLKEYAADLYNYSFRVFTTIGDIDLAAHVKNELIDIERVL